MSAKKIRVVDTRKQNKPKEKIDLNTKRGNKIIPNDVDATLKEIGIDRSKIKEVPVYKQDIKTMLDRVRSAIALCRAPERMVLEALTDEASGWEMRLDELDLPDVAQ